MSYRETLLIGGGCDGRHLEIPDLPIISVTIPSKLCVWEGPLYVTDPIVTTQIDTYRREELRINQVSFFFYVVTNMTTVQAIKRLLAHYNPTSV